MVFSPPYFSLLRGLKQETNVFRILHEKAFKHEWPKLFFHLKFTLSEELNQKWGFETECADSVNVAKPQIETQLKTDRSFYGTGGKGAF